MKNITLTPALFTNDIRVMNNDPLATTIAQPAGAEGRIELLSIESHLHRFMMPNSESRIGFDSAFLRAVPTHSP